MWLAAVAWRALRSTRATTRSPGLQLARDRLDHDGLVVAQAQDVDDLRAAVAVLALDRAAVGHLAAAGRVERATRRA